MSTQLSYLSQVGYGYDTVVAVSQIGVNSTFKNYYTAAKGKFSTVTAYFIKDSSGNAVQVDQADLLAQTNGPAFFHNNGDFAMRDRCLERAAHVKGSERQFRQLTEMIARHKKFDYASYSELLFGEG